VSKKTFQAHSVIGKRGFAFSDSKRIPLLLLTNILGGPAANSRLNLSIREKHGLTYNVESSYTPYSDTGLFTIYFGTDKANFERCNDLVFEEVNRLKVQRMGLMQLHRAKKQVLGQLAISSESNEQAMLINGKSVLVYNSIDSMEAIAAKINSISSDIILDIANEIFEEGTLSTLTYL